MDDIHRVSDTMSSTMEHIDDILSIVNVFQGRVDRVGGETHAVISAIPESLDFVLPRFEQTIATMDAIHGLKSETRSIHGCVTMSENATFTHNQHGCSPVRLDDPTNPDRLWMDAPQARTPRRAVRAVSRHS